MTRTFYGLFVSFSGESEDPISNVYALTPDLKTVSKQVLGAGPRPTKHFSDCAAWRLGPTAKGSVAHLRFPYASSTAIGKWHPSMAKGY